MSDKDTPPAVLSTDKELLSRLAKNEAVAKQLETDPEGRLELSRPIFDYGERFIDGMNRRRTYNPSDYERSEADVFFDIDGKKQDPEATLDFLHERMDRPGLNSASGRHMGYIPGGAVYTSALGDYIAAVTNPYAGVFFASPGAVRMENALINWAGQLVGYDRRCGGNLTSGGSIANLIAISTARNVKKVMGRQLHKSVIYISRQAHHSLVKALRICGMQECVLRELPVDEGFRIIPEALNKQVEADAEEGLLPFMVIATAGSTDVGAVDPLGHIADVAEKHHLWMHVDAAYGGFFLLTDRGRQKFRGIERADSIILDPHKGLFMPYGSGIALVKNVEDMTVANDFAPSYLQDADAYHQEYSPAELSPELSKHFRGLRMWLPLKLHGLAPFRAALEEKLDLASYFHQALRQLGFTPLPDPELSIVVFRYLPEKGDADRFNKKILDMVYEDGRIFISSTRLKGHFYLRVAILHFRTHRREVDLFLEVLKNSLEEMKKTKTRS